MNLTLALVFLFAGIVFAVMLSIKWPKAWAWIVAAIAAGAGYFLAAIGHLPGIGG